SQESVLKILAIVGLGFAVSAAAQNVMLMNRIGPSVSELYVANADGSGEQRLLSVSGFDYHATYSLDGKWIVFASERNGYGQADRMKPDGFFRPAWSPDGKWIAFTSDRNTEWKGHGNGSGWEHVQELTVYIVHADGTGLRRITEAGICSGSPKWSADSKQIVF